MLSSILISVFNVFLSPIGIIFFLLVTLGEGNYFESVGSNTSRLKLLPFLIHQAIFTMFVLVITYLWSVYSYGDFSPWEVFVPKYYWISVLGWMASVFVIRIYLKGMEGNVMGFIFFPMLLMTSLLLLGVNVVGFFSTENMENLKLDAPAVELNIWLLIMLHTFMPVYIIFLLQDKNRESEKDKFSGEVLLASIIFQLACFGIHWVVFWIANQQMSFSQYFGQGQNMFYYLPILIGSLYFVFKTIGNNVNKSNSIFNYTLFLLMSTAIFLEMINYVQLLKVNWLN